MGDDFLVCTSDLRLDANVWHSWSEDVLKMSAAVPLSGEELTELDFSTLDGAQKVAQAYFDAAGSFAAAIKGGSEILEEISTKLVTIADRYDEAEDGALEILSTVEG